ncbi:MAG: thiol-disulfide oxidoreductase DCC family protein [Hyphomicrobiaceae bacterium]
MTGVQAMHKLSAAPPYSYRADAAVPAFADDRPLIVFDGVCVLCSGFARFVARHDRHRQFQFTAAQSRLGQALFRHYGLDPVNYETNLLVEDGRAFGKLDAFAAIMQRLGGAGRLAGVVRVLPRGLSDWAYDRIAQNRYRLFGRSATCVMPDATWRDRVIE